jgi:hypothetical protein
MFTQHTTTKSVPSQITLKSRMNPCSGKTADFLWHYAYAVNTGGTEPWSRTPGRLTEIHPCKTVTGTVYSKVGRGTFDDEDGDLQFTLTLDKGYEQYSNPADPTCKSSYGLQNPCYT